MNFEELKSNLNTLNKESRIDELEKIKAEMYHKILEIEENFHIALREAKDLTIPKEGFEQMKVQIGTKDGEVIECDIDTYGRLKDYTRCEQEGIRDAIACIDKRISELKGE